MRRDPMIVSWNAINPKFKLAVALTILILLGYWLVKPQPVEEKPKPAEPDLPYMNDMFVAELRRIMPAVKRANPVRGDTSPTQNAYHIMVMLLHWFRIIFECVFAVSFVLIASSPPCSRQSKTFLRQAVEYLEHWLRRTPGPMVSSWRRASSMSALSRHSSCSP
jgi:hypothetical protein